MGDAEDDVETNSKITWEDIDVLKVGHHGSDTSSTEQFINKVLPEMARINNKRNFQKAKKGEKNTKKWPKKQSRHNCKNRVCGNMNMHTTY